MLGINAALDGMPAMHDRPLQHILELRTGRNQDLALDQIHVRDHFRNRMFDLNAGVHLDEVQLPVLVHQKFNRAGVHDIRSRSASCISISPISSRSSGETFTDGDSSSSF